MSCSNCYNGCPQIISDQCVKYTGIDIPVLGIKNGDSLSYVEQAIITFLTSTLDGSGIKVNIDEDIICQIVNKNLPTCGDLTVVDFIKALIQAVCELKTLVDGTIADIEDINNFITALEAAYDVDCLTGVTSTSGTHNILQAVIDKLCAFIIEVDATYVKLADLDALIAAYLASITPGVTQFNARMVPFSILPYYGSLSNFTASGEGLAANGFDKIYLCNGQNNTPDLRGRTLVGTLSMGTTPLDPQVDPAVSPGSPNYVKGTTVGVNSVTLSVGQMPQHTHTHTLSVTSPPHRHQYNFGLDDKGGTSGANNLYSTSPFKGSSSALTNFETAIINSSLTINTNGNNEAHTNIQPSFGLFYIMYIP